MSKIVSINKPFGFSPNPETEKLKKAVTTFNEKIHLKSDLRVWAKVVVNQYRAGKEKTANGFTNYT